LFISRCHALNVRGHRVCCARAKATRNHHTYTQDAHRTRQPTTLNNHCFSYSPTGVAARIFHLLLTDLGTVARSFRRFEQPLVTVGGAPAAEPTRSTTVALTSKSHPKQRPTSLKWSPHPYAEQHGIGLAAHSWHSRSFLHAPFTGSLRRDVCSASGGKQVWH
jgi:hypothetical protein